MSQRNKYSEIACVHVLHELYIRIPYDSISGLNFDFASLFRMCLQCGVPKTYSHGKGMVCPQCGDKPAQTKEPEKKKGSTVKDKEKIKRMRGQSSHASWKSETEMALRQQFD